MLITDLGSSAAPVSIVLGLRYLMAPISVWVGVRSDARPVLGLRRLPYIWLGRMFMLVAIVLLPVCTLRLATDVNDPVGWLLAAALFIFYGLGTAVSGGPFLALMHDCTPPARRGLAASIAQTLFIAGFALFGSLFGLLLRSYSAERLQSLALATGIGAGAVWLLSVLGEERPLPPGPVETTAPADLGLRDTLRRMWADPRARAFFFFLALGAIAAFAQDAVLEPFGGDVFGLTVEETTRFSSYWGAGILVAMIVTAIATRRRRPEEQVRPATIGLGVMIVGLALLTLSGLTAMRELVIPSLTVFGLGFGAYTIGGFSLIMAFTASQQAGSYLGLWTMTQLIARGIGIGLGGVVRDVALSLTGSPALSYASVFILEAIGLGACIVLLARLDAAGFAREHRAEVGAPPLAAIAD